MPIENKDRAKPTRSFTLTPKAIAILDQMHTDSGMNKSEIVNMFICNYNESLNKKICV